MLWQLCQHSPFLVCPKSRSKSKRLEPEISIQLSVCETLLTNLSFVMKGNNSQIYVHLNLIWWFWCRCQPSETLGQRCVTEQSQEGRKCPHSHSKNMTAGDHIGFQHWPLLLMGEHSKHSWCRLDLSWSLGLQAEKITNFISGCYLKDGRGIKGRQATSGLLLALSRRRLMLKPA